MVFGLKIAGKNLFNILSRIRGRTKLKNPPSKRSDIFTIASVSQARSAEYFSIARGMLSWQLHRKKYYKQGRLIRYIAYDAFQ